MASDIVRDAAAVEEDMRQNPADFAAATKHLAGLGGKARTNCSRDLRRHIGTHLRDVIEPYDVEVPLQTPQGDRYTAKIPLLLPHELMSCLFLLGWAIFAGVLLGGIPQSTNGIDVGDAQASID